MDTLFITYLLKVSFSLLIFHLVYYVFLRKLTFHKLNRCFLVFSAALSFILPLSPKLFHVPITMYESVLPIIEITGAQQSYLLQDETLSVSFFITLLWLITGLGFLLRSILIIGKLQNLKLQSEKGKWKNRAIRYNEKIETPFSFLNLIYLPKSMMVFSEERNLILEHESIHIEEGHSVDKIFIEVLSCILWFHPSIYWIKKELDSQHEFYVDRKITEASSYKKKIIYGQLLLSSVTSKNQPLLINTFYNSFIKKRILMMTQNKHQKSYLKNYATVFIATATLLLMWSCSTDSSSNQDTSKLSPVFSEMEVLDIVETMPEFIGGDDALLKFVYTAIEYPAISRENGIEGMCVAQFIVEPDGSISNIEMLRELDDATSEEVLRILKTMPNWKPGKQGGDNVRVRFKLPVKFKLE